MTASKTKDIHSPWEVSCADRNRTSRIKALFNEASALPPWKLKNYPSSTEISRPRSREATGT